MSLPWTPVVFVDITGSIITLSLALWCAYSAWQWTRGKAEDVFRQYILLLTLAIVFFAISRSFGHLVKQVLLLNGMGAVWRQMAPFSGAINSTTFIVIFAFGLYFHRIQRVHLELEKFQNNLESLVVDRTIKLEKSNIALENEIFERKRAEEKLQKWRHIFQNAKWGVILTEAGQTALGMMNPAYAAMHGYTVDEMTGFELEEVFTPAFRAELPEVINKCHEAGHYTFTADHIRKDGSTFPVYHDVTTVKSDTGKILYRIVNIQDITDRRKAEEEKGKLEEQLRQSHKMEAVGTMAGGIAHDFNNILAAIVGYAEMIWLEAPRDNHIRKDVEQILRASDRAVNLVKQILAFSRQSPQELIPIRPHMIVKETLELLRATIPATVTICQNVDSSCDMIYADPTKIHQVLMNLCSNAVHAMDEKGTIEVNLAQVDVTDTDSGSNPNRKPGPFVRLSVSDNGAGMTPDTMERIFDPFFTTKETGKGTGMGLSVVHGIINSHNGFITVDSEPGKGSTFNVFIPAISGVEKELPHATKKEDLSLGTERILLVDDEEMLVNINGRLLERLGYLVTSRTNSREALEIFKADPDGFDLVITDQTMPELSGSELANEILQTRPGMPVIICTGHSSKISEKNYQALGISAFITKPYEKNTLAGTIRKVLDTKSRCPR